MENINNLKDIKTEQKVEKVRWQYQPLSENDIQRIHETSMQVLEEVGFEVQVPEAFELFKKAGATVDHENRIVKVKESLVKELISTAPSQITLCGQDPEKDIILDSETVCFGTGGTALNVLDYDSGEQRPANMEDLIDVVKLSDSLDNIHIMLLPTYPNELPIDDVDVNRFMAGMMYTSKHVMGGIYTSKGIEDVISMAEDIAGGSKALRKRPFISMITCGISPLRLDKKYGTFMIQLAKKSIPIAVPVEPLCGATAPVTLAGTLVIQNCDGLINIMTTQLANPGTPAIYGCVGTSVNLRDISYLGGPVESGMINAGTAQLSKFYNLPYYSTAGISDSKTLDAQCGYESAVNNLLVALAGGGFIHDAAGLMEFATTVNLEKMVIDNEILGMVSRAVKGIKVNEKTLAYETIREVGPGGNFVVNRHTRKFMNKEHMLPKLSNREKRDEWVNNGSKTTADRAHEIVKEILGNKPNRYLDKDITQKLLKKYPNIREDHFSK